MRSGKTLLVVLCMTAVVLAGCSDKGGNSGDDDDDLGLTVTDTTGIIRGVVVDTAIRPIESATVLLRLADGETETTLTNEEGLFGFQGLDPGSYFVSASKLGFLEVQQSVDVVAGVKTPKAVRILLEADPQGRPYVEAYKFDGFIECSTVTVVLRLAACDLPNGWVPGMENITNDRFLPRHPVTPGGVTFVQSEMTWDSTQALGTRMNALPGWWNPDSGDWDDLASYEEESPMIMQLNETLAQLVGDNGGYQIRVFSSYPEETEACDPSGTVGCLWGVGATVEQEFVIITHVFHQFTPPEGWTFIENGPPEIPS